jgi:RNA polymerase sigma factor (sigma-70 family)
MHGFTDAASGGAPLQFSMRGPVLPETSVRLIERSLKYLAFHLAPTEDRQDDLISVGLRAIHYAHVTYEAGRGASFETFLLRCAHRAMVDFVRSERRQTSGWISGNAPIGAETEETLFDTLRDQSEVDPGHALLLQQVELAVQSLPQRQRECVRMRYYEDIDNSEIAERLGISRPRVTQLLASGIKQLRAQLSFHSLTPAANFN